VTFQDNSFDGKLFKNVNHMKENLKVIRNL
jgi:hypothetical protein